MGVTEGGAVTNGTVQERYVEAMRAELADLEKRIGNAAADRDRAQAEVDLLDGQRRELQALLRVHEEAVT